MTTTPRDLVERAAAAPGNAGVAGRLVPLLDLTSLNGDDTDARIRDLCRRAARAGTAAVCVLPRFVPLARRALGVSGVKVATVANFPDGGDDVPAAAAEVARAVEAGADEVDVVAPLGAIAGGDIGLVSEMVEGARTAAPGRTLKVILETGRLRDPSVITAAARAAIMGGADFLKTSTGKIAQGATLEAAAVLLAVIEEAEGRVGLKISGGVRTTQQAAGYLYLVDRVMGPAWASPARVRFGASTLLDDLERVLASAASPDGDANGDGGDVGGDGEAG